MSEDSCFMEAIRANPDDRALRLVDVDWLEERGDVFGKFIRVRGHYRPGNLGKPRQ